MTQGIYCSGLTVLVDTSEFCPILPSVCLCHLCIFGRELSYVTRKAQWPAEKVYENKNQRVYFYQYSVHVLEILLCSPNNANTLSNSKPLSDVLCFPLKLHEIRCLENWKSFKEIGNIHITSTNDKKIL